MTVGMVLALILAIPVILIPVALVWYINAGGIVLAIKEAKEKRAMQRQLNQKEANA